jgi:ABC-2 type transport system ATP-binding protein
MINKSKKVLEGSKKEVKDSYKTNTFRIEHKGQVQFNNGQFVIKSQRALEDDHFETIVKVEGALAPNALLQHLIAQTEVFCFEQKLPTMSEIFISLVKAEGDEALLKHLQEV